MYTNKTQLFLVKERNEEELKQKRQNNYKHPFLQANEMELFVIL
jgi:hypothetical protein